MADNNETVEISWQVLKILRETNGELENLFQAINNAHVHIRKFRDILKEKTTSGNVGYCSSLKIADSVYKFVAEQLDVLMKPKLEILKTMDDLHDCLADEDRILQFDEVYFGELVCEVTKNQKLIARIISDFNKNQDVYLFNQMMDNSEFQKF